MRLRTKKLSLRLSAAALALLAALVVVASLTSAPPAIDVAETSPPVGKAKLQDSGTSLAPASPAWSRILRQPLYDPPPPPPHVVVKEVRPITVRIAGTVVEGDNSQAFVRHQDGRVEIKRIGDSVTGDPLDGKIQTINANEVVIVREDGEHRLAIEGRN